MKTLYFIVIIQGISILLLNFCISDINKTLKIHSDVVWSSEKRITNLENAQGFECYTDFCWKVPKKDFILINFASSSKHAKYENGIIYPSKLK